jgi:hypothetical protein
MNRDYGYGYSPNQPTRPRVGRKIRHERTWRTYSDFHRPAPSYAGGPQQGQAQGMGMGREGDRYDNMQRDVNGYVLSREDILGEYEDQLGYNDDYYGDYTPVHEHDVNYGYGSEPDHSYEHWQRSKYGGSVTVPTEWSGSRQEDQYDRRMPRRGAGYRRQKMIDEQLSYQYGGDEYYAMAPEYYKKRYMPEEDYLKKLYVSMFGNFEYDIKVPIMQIIATIALAIIFVLNYQINIEYVTALGNYSGLVKYQPPILAAFFGFIVGLFLYSFPSLHQELRRTLILGTIILLIFFFALPAIWAGFSQYDLAAVGMEFFRTLDTFLRLAAVLVYWAPMFLGVYGIWSRNNFYTGISAMFLFMIIIILDIFLFYSSMDIPKIRSEWPVYVFFSIVLFCFIEMSDSATSFAKLTSTSNIKEIDPAYYEHLDRILKKYFVYFVLLTIFIIILTWLTLNFEAILHAMGSMQLAESLELSSIYGAVISLILIAIVILFIGIFVRYEENFRKVLRKVADKFTIGQPPPEYYQQYTHPVSEPKKQYYQSDRFRAY